MDLLRTLPGSTSTVSVCLIDASVLRSSPRVAELNRLLDWLGAESSIAQKLPAIITTAARVASDAAQRVYVAVETGSLRPLGFIKVGQRTLFVSVPAIAAHSRLSDPSAYVASLSQQRTGLSGARGTRGGATLSTNSVARVMGGVGSLWEMTPLCLLDFFVTEESRRRGIGRILFDTMMGAEGVLSSAVLAYDRPSRMFLSFLSRHFGLVSFTPQANNFVVFDDLFTTCRRIPELPPQAVHTIPYTTTTTEVYTNTTTNTYSDPRLQRSVIPIEAANMRSTQQQPSSSSSSSSLSSFANREQPMTTQKYKILHCVTAPNNARYGARAPGAGLQWTGGAPLRDDGLNSAAAWLDYRSGSGGGGGATMASAASIALQRGTNMLAPPTPIVTRGNNMNNNNVYAVEDRGSAIAAARRSRLAEGRRDDPWLLHGVSPTRLQRPF